MTEQVRGAIDVHAHAVPEGVIELVEAGVKGVSLEREGSALRFQFEGGLRTAPIEPGLLDVDERLRQMDAQGVEIQILSSFIDVGAHHASPDSAIEYARIFNDELAAIVAGHPDRFQGFATVPTQAPDSGAAEVLRTTQEHGFVGAEISAAAAMDGSLDDMWAQFDAARSLVLIHPESSTTAQLPYFLGNYVGNPAETTMAAADLLLSGRLEKYGNVEIFLVHGGGFLPYQIGRLEHGWKQYGQTFGANISSTPKELLRRFHFDTVVHDKATLSHLISVVGPDRVVVGTDYPFAMGDKAPVATVAAQGLTSRETSGILSGNLRRVLDRRG